MVYPYRMNKRRKSYSDANTLPPNVTYTTKYYDRGWPMWMNKGHRTYILTFLPTGGPSGGGGGGGVTIAHRDKPIPKVKVKRIEVIDKYENIDIKILQVIDMSLNGGM